MMVFRLIREKHVKTVLEGKGAYLFGGRWNPAGYHLVYTSASRALAMAEILAHALSENLRPHDYVMVDIDIPFKSLDEISQPNLQEGWDALPPIYISQKIGIQMADDGIFCHKVPSKTVAGDYNVIINPGHRDMKKVKIITIEPFGFDE